MFTYTKHESPESETFWGSCTIFNSDIIPAYSYDEHIRFDNPPTNAMRSASTIDAWNIVAMTPPYPKPMRNMHTSTLVSELILMDKTLFGIKPRYPYTNLNKITPMYIDVNTLS